MVALPTRSEALALHRLRTLRVDRARSAVRDAQASVAAAVQAVQARQCLIGALGGDIDALERSLVGGFAPQLPRWSTMVVARREALADLMERAEYDLVGDEQSLEIARDRLQQAHAEWTRAQAREDAVRDLVGQARRAHLGLGERQAERELEDQAPPMRPAA